MTSADALAKHIEDFLSDYLASYVGSVSVQQSLVLEDLTLVQRAFATVRERHDSIESLVFLRLLAEVALRFSWTTSTVETDPSTVPTRVDRMRKADLICLREAYKGIHRMGDESTPLLGELQAKIDEIPGASAPTSVANLVVGDEAKGLYATFRMCSAIVHAGSGAHRAHIMPAERAWHMAVGVAFVAISLGTVCVDALAGTYPGRWPSSELRAIIEHHRLVIDRGGLDA